MRGALQGSDQYQHADDSSDHVYTEADVYQGSAPVRSDGAYATADMYQNSAPLRASFTLDSFDA